MDYSALFLPAIIAFAAELLLGFLMIPLLHRLKFGQYIREEGPQAHQKKAGTPTMGGITFLLAMLIGTLGCLKAYPSFWVAVVMTFCFGAIGFLDDFLKVVLKHNEGLKAWQKFLLQIIFGAVFALLLKLAGCGTTVTFHIINETVDFGFFYYFLAAFAMIAVTNGTNFTDGLDGLNSTVTLVIAIFLTIAAVMAKSEVGSLSSALIGALLGFLCFNAYPAKVFMGDTGSLALGGFVTAMAFLLDMPFMLLIFGFIYVAEVVSVMLQVAYFKATHGKRLFKMAPIHHHFELMGWHETRVVVIFAITTAILCILSLIILAL
ncbi:MAG: phospho-N-acetylmuramoyl-pentapeptide-transferase [Clostridia bacterium]|nr:phospho-N-acetylmuramoyl-pentapeptide-transferase [Clostridia bacterium]